MTITVSMWETYLAFVIERHRIWENRQLGTPEPWTDDPILRSRKFTNVFRILDPGSQFIRELMEDEPSPRDALARCLLYRQTNRIEPWRAAREWLGRYPLADDMNVDLALFWNDWRRAPGNEVFTSAYLVFPGNIRGADKVMTIVERTRTAANDSSPTWQSFRGSHTLQKQVESLRSHPGVGNFIAMQVATDYNYGPHGSDQENSYVLPGPGAVNGARAIAPRTSAMDVLKRAHGTILSQHSCPGIWVHEAVRYPSLMDIQNTLCEFSKYVRWMQKPVGMDYRPANPGEQPLPWYPTHW